MPGASGFWFALVGQECPTYVANPQRKELRYEVVPISTTWWGSPTFARDRLEHFPHPDAHPDACPRLKVPANILPR